MSDRVFDDRIERGEEALDVRAVDQAISWGVSSDEPVLKVRRSKGLGCRVVEFQTYAECATCHDIWFTHFDDEDEARQ